ncbi:hypothetical protein ACO2Q3_19360 [Caulobacter sp. KR2-114]|uniref:hypothetical protein n=1 Tax=Caulobacter sp. KR2-114 TaxID=3400912 RepID=UPI003C00CDA6
MTTAWAVSGTAYAATTAYAGGSPGDVTLSIPVYAQIGSTCGFGTGLAPSGTYQLGEISDGFSQSVSFAIACSAPARVAVVSTNGGLKAAASAPTGYAAQMDYTVALTLAGDTTTASANCLASTLNTSGACSFRGPSAGTRGLKLNDTSHDAQGSSLTVSAPAWSSSNILVSSTYSDTLTVTISPSS